MKCILLFGAITASLVGCATSEKAAVESANNNRVTAKIATCEDWRSAAHKAMNLYQNGTPIEKAQTTLKKVNSNLTLDTSLIVDVAYDTQKFESKEEKDRAADNFSNHMYNFCLRL